MDTVVKIEDGDLLVCPGCGDSCELHQEGVIVYDREADGGTTRRSEVDGGALTSIDIPSADLRDANPSRHRQGLTINFKCEFCPGEFQLCIAQHKGTTLVYWRPQGDID
jgi:hypothetical protein